MNIACYDPSCRGPNANLWAVSNTDTAPLKYVPFHVCNDHLKANHEIAGAFMALCKARFDKQQDDRIEEGRWILEKKVHTWKKVKVHECKDCERTDNLWAKCTQRTDEDGYPDHRYECVCDGHISRKKPTNFGVDHLYPEEETWISK